MVKIDLDDHADRATSDPSYAPITRNVLSSELFLPAHLRLGPHNWLEFKLAIETILRVKGLPLTHLTHAGCPRALSGDKETRDQWAADDELCKAIILLNVRSDHVRLAALEHEQWPTAELWGLLVQRDSEIRRSVRDKWEWLGRVYMVMNSEPGRL